MLPLLQSAPVSDSQHKGPQGVWWQDGVDGGGPCCEVRYAAMVSGLECNESGTRHQQGATMLAPQVPCVQGTPSTGRETGKVRTKLPSWLSPPVTSWPYAAILMTSHNLDDITHTHIYTRRERSSDPRCHPF